MIVSKKRGTWTPGVRSLSQRVFVESAAQSRRFGRSAAHNAGRSQAQKTVGIDLAAVEDRASRVEHSRIAAQRQDEPVEMVAEEGHQRFVTLLHLGQGSAVDDDLVQSAAYEIGMASYKRHNAIQFRRFPQRGAVPPVQVADLLAGEVVQLDTDAEVKG